MPRVTPRSAPTNLNFESLSSTKRWYTEVVTNLRHRFRGSLILLGFLERQRLSVGNPSLSARLNWDAKNPTK
jgi:hypothetical protein